MAQQNKNSSNGGAKSGGTGKAQSGGTGKAQSGGAGNGNGNANANRTGAGNGNANRTGNGKSNGNGLTGALNTSTGDWWTPIIDFATNVPIAPDQRNLDFGAQRDAFLLGTAAQGINYTLTRALMGAATNDESRLMEDSANLDRRNNLDIMAAEQGFKLEGLQAAHHLSKDYLQSEGAETRATQQVVNEGALNVANAQSYGQIGAAQASAQGQIGAAQAMAQGNIGAAEASARGQIGAAEATAQGTIGAAREQAQAAIAVGGLSADAQKYGADRNLDAARAQAFAEQYVSEQQRAGAENVAKTQGEYGLRGIQAQQSGETERTGMTLASQERQIGLTGHEQRQTLVTEGEQSRETLRTQGDESRKSLAFDRDNAAQLAVRMSRRA